MARSRCRCALWASLALCLPAAGSAHEARLEIAGKKLTLEANAARPERDRFAFESERDQEPLRIEHDPTADGFRVLVVGEGGGGNRSALALLDPGRWKVLKRDRGWRYKDRDGTRGGITSVRLDKARGRLELSARGAGFGFAPAEAQDEIWVHVGVEDEWYCARFAGDAARKNEAGVFKARGAAAPDACPEQVCGNGVQELGEACDDGDLDPGDGCANDCTLSACEGDAFDSTFEAIQTAILDGYGCTSSLCHGDTPPHESGLSLETAVGAADLAAVLDANHQALLTAVPANNVNYGRFVVPGDPKTSLVYAALFEKTHCGPEVQSPPAACATLEAEGVQGMPSGATLAATELEAVDLWLRGGAPREGVVAGTAEKLDACLPPPNPLKIDPPAPPGAGAGVQLVSTAWPLPAQSEDEICFATYYDFTQTSLIPADQQFDCPGEFGANNPSNKCFRYHQRTLVQDPQSHHSIIFLYKGEAGPHDVLEAGTPWRQFGPWTYKPNDPADPKAGQPCDPLAVDPALGSNPDCSGQVASTVACLNYGPPDFSPGGLGGGSSDSAKQINISQETYEDHVYAAGVYDVAPMQGIAVWNSHAFNLTAGNSTMNQYFNLYLAGPSDQVYPVQQIFDASAIFTMNVPPFQAKEYCKTQTFDPGTRIFELSSHTHRHGVRWRTWEPPNTPCATGEPGSAAGVCQPGPDERLIYLSTVYNDPVQLVLDPPVALDSASPPDRTYLYCALYDNGSTPSSPSVKRQSTSPDPPFVLAFLGGPCADEVVACLDGPRKGQLCGFGTCSAASGNPGAACQAAADCPGGACEGHQGDDAFCDSEPGAGDGVCDACPVKGGVTTEDEMFILLGNYFVQP